MASPRPLTGQERLALSTRAVGFITACRNGLDDDALGEYLHEILTEMNDADPNVSLMRLSWFLVTLGGFTGMALDQWNEAAGGKPADEWLAAMGTHAAIRM